jgi:hypothetical protein
MDIEELNRRFIPPATLPPLPTHFPDLQAAEAEINKREEDHSAYLDNFLATTWPSSNSPRG